jgi:ubiquinone/menaquinone biosynthesis C-methylase UbiE
MSIEIIDNEQSAAKAFSKQSAVFDEIYANNKIIDYKRARVRRHVQEIIKPGSFILELNAGTGDDALWFAEQGHTVHATDISAGMQEQLVKKVRVNNAEDRISHELCSFTSLQKLHNKGPYDHIFSNFAGLNCTDKLDEVLKSFSPLLKKGGTITLVILPRFCVWESLLLFKGKFKTATRRWFNRKGTKSHIEGEYFKCWYYSPSYVIKNLGKDYEMLKLEALCLFVPPYYIQNFPSKYPKAFEFLMRKEERARSTWPWRNMGDYYIISFRKR